MLRRSLPLLHRRTAAGDPAGPEPGDAVSEAPAEDASAGAKGTARTAGKGRPTPKRSESEKRRRQPYVAPKDRKAASSSMRDERARRMDAMRRGEEWALPARDRGKAKALARDYVDSRRRIGELYMPSLLVLLVLVFIKVPVIEAALPILLAAGAFALISEGFLVGRKARQLAQERYPGESTQGIRWYAAMRTLQIRRMRTPKPRISPGDTF
ncbi:MAG TPA: DUF3043 domain-containing protein [Streptosporangiaceae bacterium]|nr:DUF3043 domain-containing protein [Streptosporangiaceae bacterium]